MEYTRVGQRTDFDKLDEGTAIEVYTVDGTLYEFTAYSVTDSLLIAQGRRKEEIGWVSDSVHMSWSKIAYIQGVTSGAFRSIIAASAVGLFIGGAASEISQQEGFKVKEWVYRAGANNSPSCPFIYSWNGGGYTLEGGALGTAFGKAMEGTTALGLPSLKPDVNVLRIHVTNERPETHYSSGFDCAAISGRLTR